MRASSTTLHFCSRPGSVRRVHGREQQLFSSTCCYHHTLLPSLAWLHYIHLHIHLACSSPRLLLLLQLRRHYQLQLQYCPTPNSNSTRPNSRFLASQTARAICPLIRDRPRSLWRYDDDLRYLARRAPLRLQSGRSPRHSYRTRPHPET